MRCKGKVGMWVKINTPEIVWLNSRVGYIIRVFNNNGIGYRPVYIVKLNEIAFNVSGDKVEQIGLYSYEFEKLSDEEAFVESL